MRSICRLIFCTLALFFVVWYLTRARLEINKDLLFAVAVTVVMYAILSWLYRLIRRLRPNRALWRIIYALIGLLVVLVVISVPEIRDFLLGWLAKISQPPENLLVLSILCLIVCAVCSTRPARSANSA